MSIAKGDIAVSQGGTYKCEFTTSGIASSEGTLIVRLVTSEPTNAPAIVRYSDVDLVFTCTLAQSDDATLITTKLTGARDVAGVKVGDDNKYTYTVSKPVSGSYKCEYIFADTMSPVAAFDPVTINIISMEKEIVYTTFGADIAVTLTCEVESSEEVELKFYEDENAVAASAKVVTAFANGKTTTTNKLAITADGGDRTFSCKVEEAVSSGTTTLKIVSLTRDFESVIRKNKGVTVELECQVDWWSSLEVSHQFLMMYTYLMIYTLLCRQSFTNNEVYISWKNKKLMTKTCKNEQLWLRNL